MRKKRGYSRETTTKLLRDYKLFAIACEGAEREPQYFNTFEYASTRVKVDVIKDSSDDADGASHNKSSPTWVLDRAVKYIESQGLSEEDQLYFVVDKDRWSREQLNILAEYCNRHSNWNLVISNPCFEVWLYFHFRNNIEASTSTTCKHFKSEIASFEKGGYHPYTFIPNLLNAIDNAKSADKNPTHYFSEFKETKVYQLAEALIKTIGINDFNKFVNEVIPRLIQLNIKKARVSKKANT